MANEPTAVLVSGGLDSAVLLAEAVRAYPAVFPLYVRTGLHWVAVERDYLDRFLAALRSPALHPLTVLDQPVAHGYRAPWIVSGEGVPAEEARRRADRRVARDGGEVHAVLEVTDPRERAAELARVRLRAADDPGDERQ